MPQLVITNSMFISQRKLFANTEEQRLRSLFFCCCSFFCLEQCVLFVLQIVFLDVLTICAIMLP